MHKNFKEKGVKNQKGAVILIVAFLMVVFLGFAALATDIGHIVVARNELKNAADAGALAGARFLYLDDGTAINSAANQNAYDAATANKSEKLPVEVNWTGGNDGDVQRGHWSFATHTFTPNSSLVAVDLWGATTAELDANVNFINAVKVTARRQASPIASFFANILGFSGFVLSAESVAYRGFVGSLQPLEVTEPIGICQQAILDSNGKYTCGVGRMINSGATSGHQTGGWTNFSQPCATANNPTVSPLVCGQGNPLSISLGQGIGTTGGMDQSVYDQLIQCWKLNAGPLDPNGNPTQPWKVILPVVDCPGNNLGPCSEVVGAVELNLLWITRAGVKNSLTPYPMQMGGIEGVFSSWACSDPVSPQTCWNEFISHFQLRDILNNTAAFVEDKTIYFLPDCVKHLPAGRTGGHNFGILAKIPVLVE